MIYLPGRLCRFMNRDIYKMDPETGLVDSTAIFGINMVVWVILHSTAFGQ